MEKSYFLVTEQFPFKTANYLKLVSWFSIRSVCSAHILLLHRLTECAWVLDPSCGARMAQPCPE